jgi:hypothetical protein
MSYTETMINYLCEQYCISNNIEKTLNQMIYTGIIYKIAQINKTHYGIIFTPI